jgi:hypothetical protein
MKAVTENLVLCIYDGAVFKFARDSGLIEKKSTAGSPVLRKTFVYFVQC